MATTGFITDRCFLFFPSSSLLFPFLATSTVLLLCCVSFLRSTCLFLFRCHCAFDACALLFLLLLLLPGPGAVLQSCTVESKSKIGAGAVVLEGALVEAGAMVDAGSVVHPGRRIPSGEVRAGLSPPPSSLLLPLTSQLPASSTSVAPLLFFACSCGPVTLPCLFAN